jgi:hypothetical protein
VLAGEASEDLYGDRTSQDAGKNSRIVPEAAVKLAVLVIAALKDAIIFDQLLPGGIIKFKLAIFEIFEGQLKKLF